MIDYEKKYIELLGLIKDCVPDENGFVHIKPYEMFPELKESNDERIRKTLLGYFKDQDTQYTFRGLTNDEVIKWLEKQKEKEPADKINPKFKIGDWIIKDNESVKYVKDIIDDNYAIDGGMNEIEFLPLKYVEKNYRLWTIHDAQNGDILVANGCMVIFRHIEGLNIKCHCTYHYLNNKMFFVDTLQNKTAFSPATKEQKEEMLKAVREYGYEWNEDKLELKKIEKEPVWSEEEKGNIDIIVSRLEVDIEYWGSRSKRRIDEDKRLIDWLKSIRPQNRWKPTGKQMEALKMAVGMLGEHSFSDVLDNLLTDLKNITD